jgi:hypothetical protein
VPGPLSRRSRGVPLPVSSSTSSAFPRTLSRSASRVPRQNDFMTDPLFETAAISLCSGPQVCSPPRIVPTAAAYRRRRAAEAFTSEPNRLRCLRLHRIC